VRTNSQSSGRRYVTIYKPEFVQVLSKNKHESKLYREFLGMKNVMYPNFSVHVVAKFSKRNTSLLSPAKNSKDF
jgi:hypothetical protein